MNIDRHTEDVSRRFLTLIKDRYNVAGAIVFGSRARGTHTDDSDLDLAVLLRNSTHRFLDVKLDMADTAFDVLLETGVLISPLPISVEQWKHPENYVNPSLLKNIEREGIRL